MEKSQEPLLIGNRYELSTTLGIGGMGTVYKATDRQTGGHVAVKLLRPEILAQQPELLVRFTREAEALRALDHPNIVKVLATLEEGDRHYLVMEYVEGGSLFNLLNEFKLQPGTGRMPLERILPISLDLADALTRAHRLNIIHRDLKPSNILIAKDGTPRLTDFGVARIGTAESITEVGVTVGTLDYLPPEALAGRLIDERADIWAFGVVLFEMLTGHKPFGGTTVSQVILAISTQNPPDIKELRPDVPEALEGLLFGMLEKNRDLRVASARQVGAELEAIMRGGGTTTPRTGMRLAASQSLFVPNNLPVTRAATPDDATYSLELVELSALLADSKSQAITVTPSPAYDHNRLALDSAATQLPRFVDGVYIVPRSAVDPARRSDGEAETKPAEDNLVIGELAQTLVGVLELSDVLGDRKKLLIDFLPTRRVLFIFKDLETLPPEALAFLNELLTAAPSTKLFMTAPKPLGLKGEVVFDASFIESRKAEKLLAMGIQDFKTSQAALSERAYQLVRKYIDSGRLALGTDAKALLEHTRQVSFRRQLVFRGVMVALICASATILVVGPQLLFAGPQKATPLASVTISMTVFIALCVTGAIIATYSEHRQWPRRKRMWTFPFAMGIASGLLLMILEPSQQLDFNSIPQAGFTGLILGAILGFAIFWSRPYSHQASLWKQLRPSLIAGPIIGIAAASVIIALGAADVPGSILILLVELPLLFTFFMLVINSGIEFGDRLLLRIN
ncbi:MAG TPA: protein kinase [Aggregatilineales bacterium]|nr:protein kinase [Aggregatilineales bacterium]